MAVFEKVKALVVEKLGVEEDKITLDSTFEDLGADSLDVVELVMALEEEFDLEIADEDVDSINSIGDAVAYINEHQE